MLRKMLEGRGPTSSYPRRHAETQYAAFDGQRRLDRKRAADERIADIARVAKSLPKGGRT